MKRLTIAVLVLCALTSFAIPADTYTISGTVLDTQGEKVVTTVLLQTEDGVEVQRTETKGRMGMGKGKFKFKDVLPGEYVLDVNAGPLGKASVPVSVIANDVEDLELHLSQAPPPSTTAAVTPGEEETADKTPAAGSQDQSYVINELSFEIKKMVAEIKHLNTEVNDLKAMSKMWVNPLAIYSKEIILKNGSTVFGKIVYQDEKSLKVETLVGYLIIERDNIVRVVDNIITEEQQEYIPEQIRDSYSPPPMPKLAQPQYTSADPMTREAAKQFSANCVLVGNITEKKDKQGNLIFTGEIKNIGGRRADFVKVDFVFRKNWSGETKTLTSFVRGAYHTFDSGITTDASLLPGAVGTFELYVPHSFGAFIGYSYVIDWEEYE
ncbi:MAG: hypothetical protein ACE5D8_00050 [Fidelibacterota bacterium]